MPTTKLGGVDFTPVEILLPKTCRLPHVGGTLENGIKVIAIQDPTATMASVAFNVRAGSNHDPVELPGLAHLCEHMVFLGTESYPDETEFNTFVSKHGGGSNAWTEDDATTYHANVAAAAFPELLPRFLEFFVCPKLTPSGLEREVRAVHSEDEKNHASDYWRAQEILKSAMREDHPKFRYGNGNLQTLWTQPRANGVDVHAQLNAFFRKYYVAEAACVAFYGPMAVEEILAAAAPTLLRMRRADGSTAKVAPTTFLGKSVNPMSDQTGRGQMYCIKAASDDSLQLSMTFPVPFSRDVVKRDPTVYATHVLGHECNAFLFGELKRRGLAEELSASSGSCEIDDDWDFFTIEVDLTTEGAKRVEEVAALVFEAIGAVRSHQGGKTSPELLDDAVATAKRRYMLNEMMDPTEHIAGISGNANKFGLRFAWSQLFSEDAGPDAAMSVDVLSHLYPRNCHFQLLLPQFEDATAAPRRSRSGSCAPSHGEVSDCSEHHGGEEDHHEEDDEESHHDEHHEEGEHDEDDEVDAAALLAAMPEWIPTRLGTKTTHHAATYEHVAVPDALLDEWSTLSDFQKSSSSLLKMPPVNPLLPNIAAAESGMELEPAGTNKYPSELPLGDNSFGRVWFKTDDGQHKMPKVVAWMQLESPHTVASPLSAFLNSLAIKLVEHVTTELRYFASLAGCDVAVQASVAGPLLTIEGPRLTVEQLLLTLTEVWLSDPTTPGGVSSVTIRDDEDLETVFSNCVERNLREWLAWHSVEPHEASASLRADSMYAARQQFEDVIKAGQVFAETVSSGMALEAFRSFVKEIRNGMRYDCMLVGNLNESHVASVATELNSRFARSGCVVASEASLAPTMAVHQIPRDPHATWLLQTPSFNPHDPANSSIEVIFQLGARDVRTRNLASLLDSLIGSAFFDAMRTDECLGYTVYACSPQVMDDLVLANFVIMSADVDPLYLLSRVEAFLIAAQESLINTITVESLAPILESERAVLEDTSKSLGEEIEFWWHRRRHPIGFDVNDRRIEDLSSITPEAIQKFFAERLSRGGGERRTLAIAVYGESVNSTMLPCDAAFPQVDLKFAPQRPPPEKTDAQSEDDDEEEPSAADGDKEGAALPAQRRRLELPTFRGSPGTPPTEVASPVSGAPLRLMGLGDLPNFRKTVCENFVTFKQ